MIMFRQWLYFSMLVILGATLAGGFAESSMATLDEGNDPLGKTYTEAVDGRNAGQYRVGPRLSAAPLEPTGGRPLAEHGQKEGAIKVSLFLQILEEQPDSIWIIDVRSNEQFKTGSFSQAINIPLDNIPDQIDELPADKPIVFVCHLGTRSSEAYDLVHMFREELELYYLDAVTTFYQDGSYRIVPE